MTGVDGSMSEEQQGGLRGPYSVEEDRRRTNLHYDQPSRFFADVLGGPWNIYSCNLWENARDEMESQEHKLDLLASLAQLKQGQRVLDVGCGWGGHLTYFAKKYQVTGVGLTLSPRQREYSENRIREAGVDAVVFECHWMEFEDSLGFDLVYTDEALVHFSDLAGYFTKVASLLRPGGRMLNKEIHFASTRWMKETPARRFLNEVYGQTGFYRTLHEELEILDHCGFSLERHQQISMENGVKTVDQWLRNMDLHRANLEQEVGPEYYRRFATYLRLTRRIMRGQSMTLDVVVSTRSDAANWSGA